MTEILIVLLGYALLLSVAFMAYRYHRHKDFQAVEKRTEAWYRAQLNALQWRMDQWPDDEETK